jgi:hypothetical protein
MACRMQKLQSRYLVLSPRYKLDTFSVGAWDFVSEPNYKVFR